MGAAPAVEICFESSRFTKSGPPHEDAINDFYGHDLAEWLCTQLSPEGYHFGAEDWGWYVETKLTRQEPLGFRSHEICVYDEQGTPTSWRLLVRTLEKGKWLGLVTRWKPIAADSDFVALLVRQLESVAQGAIQTETVMFP